MPVITTAFGSQTLNDNEVDAATRILRQFGVQFSVTGTPEENADPFDAMDEYEAIDVNRRYEMYSTEGNDACEAAVANIANVADTVSGSVTREEVKCLIQNAFKSVRAAGFGEVYDTEPQYQIVEEVNIRVCAPYGIPGISRDEV